MDDKRLPPVLGERNEPEKEGVEVRNDALLHLFRLLLREPPPDHDFTTCRICKKLGIREI